MAKTVMETVHFLQNPQRVGERVSPMEVAKIENHSRVEG